MSALMKQWDGMLWHAASDGDLKRMREAIERGADVNVMPNGVAAIHRAASRGWLDACQLLVDAGAEVSPVSTTGRGNSTLHCLLETGYVVRLEILRFFLERGANPNHARVEQGATPLHMAAREVDPAGAEAMRLLVQFGANPNVVDSFGITPLHNANAAARKSMLNVRTLVELGADPGFLPVDPALDQLTPFQSALRRGRREVVEYYIDECGQSLDQITADGSSMLQLASTNERALELYLSLRAREAVNAGIATGEANGAPAPAARRADCSLL